MINLTYVKPGIDRWYICCLHCVQIQDTNIVQEIAKECSEKAGTNDKTHVA